MPEKIVERYTELSLPFKLNFFIKLDVFVVKIFINKGKKHIKAVKRQRTTFFHKWLSGCLSKKSTVIPIHPIDIIL